jgi:hypothetical protein
MIGRVDDGQIIERYPLAWPGGWRRSTGWRIRANFSRFKKQLSVFDGVQRVSCELERLGVSQANFAISSNLRLRIDGLPRSDQAEPGDPGAAVYWRKGKETRCMAVDRYDRVADNLAAIAATLEAMRAIERHGGAAILDRAFIGFKQLPAPEQWWQVLGLDTDHPTREQIQAAYLEKAKERHPDIPGGDPTAMARINAARDRGLEELSQ